jgi:hypothetical protein
LWSEAPPFGVHAIVYHQADGGTLYDERGDDVAVHRWPAGYDPHTPIGVCYYTGRPEGANATTKMGLWTDGAEYWRVHDIARGEVSP